MLQEFKKFIFKGDVIALATGVIIGGAFGEIVKAFTAGIVDPLLSLFGDKPDVALTIPIKYGEAVEGQEAPVLAAIDLGIIINAIIAFLITAAIIFFFIVKPSQAFMKRLKAEEEAAPPKPAEDIVLLTEIRDALQKNG